MSENVKNTEAKKLPKISEKNLAVIITAAILAVVLIAAAIVSVIDLAKKDYGFDYLKSNLDSYIKFDKSYKELKADIDIAKPHDIDVDVAILNLIYSDRVLNEENIGVNIKVNHTISAGDIVNIWYRGYIFDEDGNKVEVNRMCNFGDETPYALNVGSGNFIPGFELNLVGVNIDDYSKFEKITMGKPLAHQIAYISYTLPDKTDSTKKVTYNTVAVDLSSDDIDATYGEGFKEKLMSFTIGQKKDVTLTLDGKQIIYSDLTLNFVTECEVNPIIVDCYFGYDYSEKTLRNETACFEVYVESVTDYDCPEFNDEYIEKLIKDHEINLTLEELNKYEGEGSAEKYRKFVAASLDEIYQEAYIDRVESAIWAHVVEISKLKKIPGYIVDDAYDYYMNELRMAFRASGGQVYSSSTQKYNTYDTLEKYIPAYLGLSSSQNYVKYLTDMAEETAQERIAMFYILRAEKLLPSDKELAATMEVIRQEYLDSYVEQYLAQKGKSKYEYTDEEYAEIVDGCKADIFSYYDDEYFTIKAYQRIFRDLAMKWPGIEISTLDDRRAYPFDK